MSRTKAADTTSDGLENISAHADFTGGVASANPRDVLAPLSARSRLTLLRTTGVRAASGITGFACRIGDFAAEEVNYGHLFLFVPVFLGLGAIIWFRLPDDPPLAHIVVLALVLLPLIRWLRYRAPVICAMVSAGFLLFAGMILADIESRRHSTIMLDSPVTTMVAGIVERREADGANRWRYIIRVVETSQPTIRRPPERVSVLARSRHDAVVPGEWIRGRARLSPPSGPALPGLVNFSFSSYFNGLGAVGFFYGAPSAMSPLEDKLPQNGWLRAVDAWLYDLRSAIAARIRATVSGDAGAFAAAIVTDERRAISKETTEALRVSGLAHIVAISGLNMALAAGIFFVGVRTVLSLFSNFAEAWPIKKIAAAGALAMATAYYLISGFAVSAERAYLMMAIMLIAVFFDRPSISLRNVALSAIIILAISPSEVMGPSFQMSFAATLALVAGYSLWRDRSRERENNPAVSRTMVANTGRFAWRFVMGIVVTSLIGGVSTAIYSIDHFHRIATYGLPANLAAMPVMSFVVMPAALVGMLLMPFGLDGFFIRIAGWGLQLVIDIAVQVSSWGGDVGAGRQHVWFLAISSAGFVLSMILRSKLRLIGIPVMAVAILLSLAERRKPLPDLLIADDAQLVGLIQGGYVATNRARPPDFIYGQWQRALMLPDHKASVMLDDDIGISPVGDNAGRHRSLDEEDYRKVKRQMLAALDTDGGFVCVRKSWCIIRAERGPVIAVVEDTMFAGAACDVAGIVIVARRLRFDACASGALLVTGETLRRTGALEIRFGQENVFDGMKIDAALYGVERSWTRHRHYDWRSGAEDASVPASLSMFVNGSGG